MTPVSTCPKCGAPIYMPTGGNGTQLPMAQHTCMCRFDTHPAKTSDWNCDDVNIGNLEKDIKQFCKDNFRLAPFFVMLYHALNIHPEKTLTENITEIKRTSDQSITIVFTSCRSASEFETILRKAQEK